MYNFFKYSMIIIVFVFFTGCTFIQDIKKVKNEVVNSLNFNKDQQVNTQQIQNQYSKYMQNFSNDTSTYFSDSRFEPSLGKTGLWIPMKFIDEVGGGLFFIDGFDQNKEPVLFIHGAGGNPREWISIAKSLSSKFQVIVASYPSGMRLGLSGRVIYESLHYLINKYDYKKVSIVAHSMGGLVAKKVIDNMSIKEQGRMKKFITISTPWGGDELASKSSTLTYSLPYWVDIKPNSRFLKEIYYRPYPKELKHYLLFGYKGEITFTKGTSNDGVVTLQSQLYPEMQEKAYKVLGYNETHTSILRSQRLIEKIQKILE